MRCVTFTPWYNENGSFGEEGGQMNAERMAILQFHGTWRSYQKRVLDRAQEYFKDGKIHIVAAPEDYISQDLKKPKLITISTYQALHSAMSEGKVSQIASFGTLCLDECHHLRNEWWGALEKSKEERGPFMVVALTTTAAIKKLLTTSKGKCESIKEIASYEYATMGCSLRMLILTDYIRGEYEKVIGTQEHVSALGVITHFEQLWREFGQKGARLGVLCGSAVIIPAEAKEALLAFDVLKAAERCCEGDAGTGGTRSMDFGCDFPGGCALLLFV